MYTAMGECMEDTEETLEGIARSFYCQYIRFRIEGIKYLESSIHLGVIHCYLTHASWHEDIFTLSCESQLENFWKEKNRTLA